MGILQPPAPTIPQFNRVRGPRWVSCARRAQLGGTTSMKSAGNRKGATARQWDCTPLGGDLFALRLVYANVYGGVTAAPNGGGSSGEAFDVNPVTYAASIELNSNPALTYWSSPNGGQLLYPVTFGGQASITVPPGSVVRSDPVYLTLPPGTPFYIRTWCSEPVAGVFPVRTYSLPERSEGTNMGFLPVTYGTGNGSATAFSYIAPSTHLPLVPGSVLLAVPGNALVRDNGSGGFPVGTGVAAGSTVNYATGAVSINTAAAVANGATIGGFVIGGAAPADETRAAALTNYRSANFSNDNLNLLWGPIAVEGLTSSDLRATAPRSVALLGDSIMQGVGNAASSQDIGWADYCIAGRLGVAKGSISGEQLGSWSQPIGCMKRIASFSGAVHRVLHGEGTNDIYNGRTLSRLISHLQAAVPAYSAELPNGQRDAWFVTMAPRTMSPASTTPVTPTGGPYTAPGAAFGPGAVTGGVRTVQVVADGTATTFTATIPGAPLLVGSIWANGFGISAVDATGSGALTGNKVASGTVDPGTGALSVTLTAAPPAGTTLEFCAYSAGPSARNAWNHFLFNWAVPRGLIGGVVDINLAVEANPASAAGAGDGAWRSSVDTADGVHLSPAGQQTRVPSVIGPAGSSPSPVWSFPPA